MPKPYPSKRQNRRQAQDLASLPRSAALSHLRKAAEKASPPNQPPLSAFAPTAVYRWILSYLKYVIYPRHPFPDQSTSASRAIYPLGGDLGESVTVCLASDWATGTAESASVAQQMQQCDPDFTIHLGDVYYVGGWAEVGENCLGVVDPRNNYVPVRWPHGRRGSFALNGNHEMYGNGRAYFDEFLPTLGLGQAGEPGRQKTSFFCLENRFWRILALDTGYNSLGIPVLSQLPGVENLPGVQGNCALRPELMQWLQETIHPAGDTRGVILLSHHQYYSGFEREYPRPAEQLWQVGIQRPCLWFWGHEHRLAGYELYGSKDLKVHGRCLGHGGMPIEVKTPSRPPEPLFYDTRLAPSGFGVNGFARLTLQGPEAVVTYVDMHGESLLEEAWQVDEAGKVKLGSLKKLTQDFGVVVRS